MKKEMTPGTESPDADLAPGELLSQRAEQLRASRSGATWVPCQRTEHQVTQKLLLGLESNGICPAELQACLDLDAFSPEFLP